MPHKDSTENASGVAGEQPPSADRGILNTVDADTDAELKEKAEEFYDNLSDKQKGVVQAKQRAEHYLAKIMHADSKAEQVGQMDRKVMNGSVFAQAARLQVSEAGYDGAENEDEEEGREGDDKADSKQHSTAAADMGADDNQVQAESSDADGIEQKAEKDEAERRGAHTTEERKHKHHKHHEHRAAAE